MEIHFKIIGVILILLALAHSAFPRYFKWEVELASLSLASRQIVGVHTFFIALTVFLMGALCLTSASELINTDLGKRISLGIGVFWSIRLLFQFFVFSKDLWKGKRFETLIHIASTILWVYLSTVFIKVGVS